MKKPMKHVTKIIIICAACIAVIVGIVLLIRYGNIGKKADVFPVLLLNENNVGQGSTLSASVTEGRLQQIKLKEGLVNDIRVKEGDTVNKGDVLMSYDQTSFQVTLMKDQARIASCEASIAMCEENIQRLSHLKPKEEAPQPYVEIIDHGELPVKRTLTDADEKDSVILFETTITKEFLEKLKDTGGDAHLKVYQEMTIPGGIDQTLFGTYTIIGSDLEEIEDDWCLANIISVNKDGTGVTFNTSKALDYKYKGNFDSCTPKRYERYEKIIHYPDAADSEDYVYTRAELAAMIKEKADEASNLKKELTTERINYEMDKLVGENGEVKAAINGIVSKVVSPAETSVGNVIIEVKGMDKNIITTYVNEMDLDTISIGDKMDIYLFERGISVKAKVVKIEKEPASKRIDGGNPNVSYYPVLAEIEDKTITLKIGESADATLDSNKEDNTLYIPKMYVRKDEGGQYVMKAVHGRLKKQYVKAGKTYNFYLIAIKEGLSLEDYISFPYDKGAIQGVTVVQKEEIVY